MVRSLVRVLALAAALVAPGASGLHGAPRVHRTPAATTTPAFVNGASPTQLRRQRVAPSLPGAGCTKTSTTVMSAVDPNNVIDVITQVAVAAKAVGTDMEIYVPPNPFQGSVDDGVHIKSWLGFLGGTVGVVGTLATYEMGRFRMKQRIVCPYCEGGVITCGMCLGEGNVIPQKMSSGGSGNDAGPSPGSMASQLQSQCGCPNCGGIGVVACVNCKGEGVTIPIMLQRKQNEFGSVDEFDIALEEMGLASLAANYVNQRARERLDREVAIHAKQLEMGDKVREEGGDLAAVTKEEVVEVLEK
mmetsp:Transcript_9134/g.21507  ORF Transcript_9134/g.21507 Transcript_9134/m.21507 type:complete len:302 (+) Transcript_9134:88-993(+)